MQIACEADKHKRRLHVPKHPKSCMASISLETDFHLCRVVPLGLLSRFSHPRTMHTLNQSVCFLSDSGAFSLFSVCKLLHPFKGCSAYGLSSSGCLLQSPMNRVRRVAPFSFNITAFDKASNSQSPNSSCKSVNIMTTQRKRLQEPKGKCAP